MAVSWWCHRRFLAYRRFGAIPNLPSDQQRVKHHETPQAHPPSITSSRTQSGRSVPGPGANGGQRCSGRTRQPLRYQQRQRASRRWTAFFHRWEIHRRQPRPHRETQQPAGRDVCRRSEISPQLRRHLAHPRPSRTRLLRASPLPAASARQQTLDRFFPPLGNSPTPAAPAPRNSTACRA